MMSIRIKEYSAVIITLVVLIGLPLIIFHFAPWKAQDDRRVIHLTARMDGGIWTADKVNGLNYWWKDFTSSTLILETGKEVILRLSSSDVTHSFYIPELYPEPVIVKAGYTKEIYLRPQTEGEFTYYCITVCGECHYSMQGTIRVVANMDENDLVFEHDNHVFCDHPDPLQIYTNTRARGKFLYENKGCITCHGQNGRGGISNPNYVNLHVPALNTIAEGMKLYWQEDADTIIYLLEQNADMDALTANPPIEGYNRFLAQFNSYREKIISGAPQLQKLEREGFEPPLIMPSWEHQLSNDDLNAVLAYLISEFPWEEYE